MSRLASSPLSGSIEGFVDLGQFETEGSGKELADHGLLTMSKEQGQSSTNNDFIRHCDYGGLLNLSSGLSGLVSALEESFYRVLQFKENERTKDARLCHVPPKC